MKPDAHDDMVRVKARRKTLLRALAMVAIAAVMTGCQPGRYAVIPMEPGAAPADVQQVARRAQSGDKKAQYVLGRMLITGKRVPQNVGAGLRLIRMAANDIPASYVVTVPATSKGAAPYTVIVYNSVHGPGLPEAKALLATVEEMPRQQKTKPQAPDPSEADEELDEKVRIN